MVDIIERLESWVKPPLEHFLPHLRGDIRSAIHEIKWLRTEMQLLQVMHELERSLGERTNGDRG